VLPPTSWSEKWSAGSQNADAKPSGAAGGRETAVMFETSAGVAAAAPTLPSAPSDWEIIRTEGLGPFITRVLYRRPDGVELEWTSRRHRKGQGLRFLRAPSRDVAPSLGRVSVPRRTWWISGLFAIGSICFAVGALPLYLDRVSPRIDGLTFFIGSIFFTTASYLSFVEAANAPAAIQAGPVHHLPFRLARWRPRSIDWWATAIQLVGTVYFNVMTFLALFDNWSVSQEDRLVWRPDVIGSLCFLVASYLAWAEVCHSAGRLRFGDLSWWIVVLNLLGSIAFGVSAIGAFVDPDTGDVTNLRWDNGGTVVGAICFLVAAVMLIPEARSARAPTADESTARR
jgi:hypothetical protein